MIDDLRVTRNENEKGAGSSSCPPLRSDAGLRLLSGGRQAQAELRASAIHRAVAYRASVLLCHYAHERESKPCATRVVVARGKIPLEPFEQLILPVGADAWSPVLYPDFPARAAAFQAHVPSCAGP